MRDSGDRCSSCGLSPYERGIGDSDISRIVAERNALLACSARQKEALEWYAERRNYLPAAPSGTIVSDPAGWVATVDSYDGKGPGARARAALGDS